MFHKGDNEEWHDTPQSVWDKNQALIKTTEERDAALADATYWRERCLAHEAEPRPTMPIMHGDQNVTEIVRVMFDALVGSLDRRRTRGIEGRSMLIRLTPKAEV